MAAFARQQLTRDFTWNRPEAGELAKLYALAAPNYAAVIESYQKAQEVAKQAR